MSARHNRPRPCYDCDLFGDTGFACRRHHRWFERFMSDYWYSVAWCTVVNFTLPASKLRRRVWVKR